jgi:hypothetical protein
MKKLAVLLVCMSMVLCGGLAFAQVNNLNEPGSILVYPYVETAGINYNNTLIKIANRSDAAVTLGYFALNKDRNTDCDFVKQDGIIELSGKEVFYWNVRRGVFPTDPGESDNFIAGMPNFQGLIFVWAMNNAADQLEITFNYLIGSAILVDNAGAAAQYNAIPHQAITAVVGDRVLNLDGVEYTMATSRVFFEGFTAGAFGLPFDGFLAVANLDIDFILSIQPDFDINLDVHNVWEWKFSRHFDFCQFETYGLTDADIDLTRTALGSDVFQAATTSTDAIWAVFVQDISLAAGEFDWATNVWQDPARGASAVVVLPPVTQ